MIYPCGDLKDNYPNGFWVDKLISDVFVFIDGPEQSFDGNFMLMRNEYIKFFDPTIPKTQDQLLCGDRYTVLEACDGEKRTQDTIDELITSETLANPLGSYSKFRVLATKDN